MKEGKIFVISGPSGSGKSTILKQVFKEIDKVYFSISATTREMRPGERDGVEYYFVSHDEFMRMIENDELLEYTQYVGNFYGTPIVPILKHKEEGYAVFLDVEIEGNMHVRERLPEAVSIFIAPPSVEELERRLRSRSTESEEKIMKRLQRAQEELKAVDQYDYVVVNDVAERAANEVLNIVKCEFNKIDN